MPVQELAVASALACSSVHACVCVFASGFLYPLCFSVQCRQVIMIYVGQFCTVSTECVDQPHPRRSHSSHTSCD